MAEIQYRIHPSVGVARMGDAVGHFFVGPEDPRLPAQPIIRTIPDGTAFPNGALSVVVPGREGKFRVSEGGPIAPQAARFRVFAYYWADTSADDLYPTGVWEYDANDYDFEWTVEVVNRKRGLADSQQIAPGAISLSTTEQQSFAAPVELRMAPPKDHRLSLGKVILDSPLDPSDNTDGSKGDTPCNRI